MGLPNQTFTREQIAARILAGENIVVLRNKVLRVPPSWLTAHPGGPLAILHFVGRDASDEVDAFHSAETLKKVAHYVIGTVELGQHGWEPFVPPVMSGWVRKIGTDGSKEWYNEATAVRSLEDTKMSPGAQIMLVKREENVQQQTGPTIATLEPGASSLSLKLQMEHSIAYKELHQRIKDAGLYQTRYLAGYGPEIVRYLLFIVVSAFAYYHRWFITSAVFLGFLWHQITFTAHDLGHNGVTHNWVVDRLLGTFIADFIGGMSINWWVDVSTELHTFMRTGSNEFSRTTIHTIVSLGNSALVFAADVLFCKVVTNHPSQ